MSQKLQIKRQVSPEETCAICNPNLLQYDKPTSSHISCHLNLGCPREFVNTTSWRCKEASANRRIPQRGCWVSNLITSKFMMSLGAASSKIYQSCQSCQELLQAKVTAPPLVAKMYCYFHSYFYKYHIFPVIHERILLNILR